MAPLPYNGFSISPLASPLQGLPRVPSLKASEAFPAFAPPHLKPSCLVSPSLKAGGCKGWDELLSAGLYARCYPRCLLELVETFAVVLMQTWKTWPVGGDTWALGT